MVPYPLAMADIEFILNVEHIDRDIFRGPVVESNLQRTFGGQVAAQTLVAATKTVGNEYQVHSLHGYFVAPGRSTEPTVFMVDRIRDGRSFCSRQVKAVQDGQAIFVMQASFHRKGDQGISHQDRMRTVPDPESIVMDTSSMHHTTKALLEEWSEWDIRVHFDVHVRYDAAAIGAGSTPGCSGSGGVAGSCVMVPSSVSCRRLAAV